MIILKVLYGISDVALKNYVVPLHDALEGREVLTEAFLSSISLLHLVDAPLVIGIASRLHVSSRLDDKGNGQPIPPGDNWMSTNS